jgi:hypothetical protein
VSKEVDCTTGDCVAVKEIYVKSKKEGRRAVEETNFGKEFHVCILSRVP